MRGLAEGPRGRAWIGMRRRLGRNDGVLLQRIDPRGWATKPGLMLVACVAAFLASGCGTATVLPSMTSPEPSLPATPAAQAAAASPSATPWRLASPSDPVDLVTYEPGSACVSVQVTTPIAKVPAACAAAWRYYRVAYVPGQDAMKRTPHFPDVIAPKGVNSAIAARLAAAMWRTETFEAFALGTGQLYIVDGLGQNYLFQQVGVMEQALAKGDRVSTPLCHFFPTAIHIVPLAHDFASYVHRPDGFLGVEFTFTGPCYATATNKAGQTSELFRFNGQRSTVFVGDIGKGDPLGPVLVLTTFGECDQAVVKATCAQ